MFVFVLVKHDQENAHNEHSTPTEIVGVFASRHLAFNAIPGEAESEDVAYEIEEHAVQHGFKQGV